MRICKTIVENLGGEIEVQSRLGRGTKVSFRVAMGEQKREKELHLDLRSEISDSLIPDLDVLVSPCPKSLIPFE